MPRSLLSWSSIALVFGLLSPLPVRAQSSEESLPTGARVRVTLAGDSDPARTGPRLTGRLAETRAESILLATSDSEIRELRREAIVRLERSMRRSRKARGAWIGFGVGFASWVSLCVLASEGEHVTECAAGSALLSLPTAAVGAWVAPGEQWADVPLGIRTSGRGGSNRGLQVRVVPVVGRCSGLAVAASF